MKYFYSNSALIFIFYLITQKHSNNVIVENIFRFNMICLMLTLIPFQFNHFRNTSNTTEEEKITTIFEEKQLAEEQHKKLSESPQLRNKSHLTSLLLGFWMSSLMMNFILRLDK